MRKPIVVITDLSNRITYYQWFIYGFMLLKKAGVIKLRFDIPFGQKLYLIPYLGFIIYIFKKLKSKCHYSAEIKTKAYLKGYIIDENGLSHTFCIDSADSPNMFSGKLLQETDLYFKIQCPKEFDSRGFRLGDIFIPFFDVEFANPKDTGKVKAKRKLCPDVYKYQDKIKPLLSAVRSMGRTCSFIELHARYNRLLSARKVKQTEKAMCYFGNAQGPIPTPNVKDPDYDWESDILGYYGDKLNHPNEKRAKITQILKSFGNGYDARLINDGHSDQGQCTHKEQIIPLKDFSKHVARFQYNINVSGYRMSIPSRFIDSFVCGTAIATDNLSVKWYQPFGNEVCEIGEMGYLPDNKIDYAKIEEELKSLKSVSRDYVIERYEKYYSPIACAKYMLNTILNK